MDTYTFKNFLEEVRTEWMREESIFAILEENPRFIGLSSENDGRRVIHVAREGEYFEIVEYLLKNRVCA